MTTVNFDEVVELVRAQGIAAYVEQTGGGCATILAGTLSEDGRAVAAAGPGWFEGPGWTLGRGDTDELFVGRDDSGESESAMADASWDERCVADELVKVVREEATR